MKIASIYNFTAFPPKGGNHLHAVQLIRQFQAAGHEVLTLGDPSVPGVHYFQRDVMGVREINAQSDVLYVRIDGNHIRNDPLLIRLLQTTTKPCVWEINSPADETLAYSYLGGASIPNNIFARITDRAKRESHAWRKRPGIRQEDELRKQLAARAYAATCVSSQLARYAQVALRMKRTYVVPNGADPETHHPDGPIAEIPSRFASHLKVLFAGSPIYPWQGVQLLLQTMELCKNAGDKICFIMLLNQPPLSPLAFDNVFVLLEVPHDAVAGYLRAADAAIVVQPDLFWSEWGTHFSPMKLFDYMACGTPVIGSRMGQVSQVIQDGRNGFLFQNTPEELRMCLLRALEKKNDLRAMGKVARKDVEHTYNWKHVAARTLHILEDAVREKSPASSATTLETSKDD